MQGWQAAAVPGVLAGRAALARPCITAVPCPTCRLTLNVRKMFQEMDRALFEECQRKYEEEQVRQSQQRAWGSRAGL